MEFQSNKRRYFQMDAGLFKKNNAIGVAIITASCCYPGVAPFEEQAKRVIEQAISESGVDAQLKILPVSSYYNSIPREVIPRLIADYNQGKISAPAILIEGKAAFYGVPGIEEMKTLLLQVAEARKTKEVTAREPETKSADIA
jgi:hypothetical protein